MENSMMKRGIGAVVLAVIAALLLAYLLKGKSTERQEVVDMQLPGTPEMNIPSLSEAGDTVASAVTDTGDSLSNATSGTGTAIVASAAGAGAAVVGSVKAAGNKAAAIIVSSDSTDATGGNAQNPGFSIRPSQSNEQREIIDNTASKKEKYKPRLIDEKKKVVKKSTPKPKKVVKTKKETKKPTKKVAKKAAPKSVAPKAASIATAAPAGRYSIQLLATSSSSRASKLSKVMKSEGYTTFITETSNNNKVLYRVRVGGYGNRNKAIQVQESMKRRYAKNFFVQNSLVVSK